MRPPGRQTRRISRATADRIGHDADQVRRVDDVEESSANLRSAASICSSRTLRTSLRATRSRAFSSIEHEKSMPVTEQSRG